MGEVKILIEFLRLAGAGPVKFLLIFPSVICLLLAVLWIIEYRNRIKFYEPTINDLKEIAKAQDAREAQYQELLGKAMEVLGSLKELMRGCLRNQR